MYNFNSSLLRARMAMKGVNQHQLATQMGVDPGTVSDVMRGKVVPGSVFSNLVSDVLDLSSEEAAQIFFSKKLNQLVSADER